MRSPSRKKRARLRVVIAMRRAHCRSLAFVLLGCTPATAPPTESPSPVETPVPSPEPIASDPPPADVPVADAAPAPDAGAGVIENGWQGAIFGALVEPQRKQWEVVLVDYEPIDDPSLRRGEEQELMVDALPAGHMWIPKGWATGDSWTLLTRTGGVTRKVKAFGAWTSAASGTLHVEVLLGAAGKSKGPAIALRGSPSGAPTKLAKLVPVALAQLGDGALGRIDDAVVAGHEPEDRARLGTRKLVAKHVRVLAGAFPGGRTHAIVVRRALADEFAVHALLFAKGDGAIELVHLGHPYGSLELFAIVDLDGDATDELVFEQGINDEGWQLQLVHWDGDAPKLRMLTGNGL